MAPRHVKPGSTLSSRHEEAVEAASDRAAFSCWRQCGLSMLCLMAVLQLLAAMVQGTVTWNSVSMDM